MNVYKRLAVALIAVLIFICCFSNSVLAASGEKVTLGLWNRVENLAFQMTNMVPGDSETKEYAIAINDKRAVSLQFSIELSESDKMLADVLHIQVEQDDNILYGGMLAEMPALTVKLAMKIPQTVNFRITVSLDTSVGNEYMGQTLSADFNWSIKREPEELEPIVETSITTHTTLVESTTASSSTESSEQTTADSSSTEIVIEQTSETAVEQTTTESSVMETTMESSIKETTTASSTTETTTDEIGFYEETTTNVAPFAPMNYCCECCIGYRFPYSCNFGNFREGDIGCDLPWCCAGNNECWCPWCWIIPLIILIVFIIIVIIVIRKLVKKSKEDEEEGVENVDEQTTEKDN